MSELYLLIDGEQKGPFSRQQVSSMYNSATITSQTHFWKEGQPEWLPIDHLFTPQESEETPLADDVSEVAFRTPRIVHAPVQPSLMQNRGNPEPSKSRSVLIWIIGVALVSGIGTSVYVLSNNRDANAKKEQEIAIQQRQLPVEIKLAINNIRSATQTDTDKDTYTNLVVALKSSVSTFGQNVPADEIEQLKRIVGKYDFVVQLWDKVKNGGMVGDPVIQLDNKYDAFLAQQLSDLKLDLTDESDQSGLSQYNAKAAMGQIWKLTGVQIDKLYQMEKSKQGE